MIFSNVFITREVSAIGRKSLGSFGLSFLGIGITVESFQMSGMMHVSMEVWKRRWKTPLSCSAQNLRVLPQIPSGPGHLFTPVCLNSLNTLSWSITALSSGIKNCFTSEMCDEKSCVSKRVKKLFMRFGNASSATPTRLANPSTRHPRCCPWGVWGYSVGNY